MTECSGSVLSWPWNVLIAVGLLGSLVLALAVGAFIGAVAQDMKNKP